MSESIFQDSKVYLEWGNALLRIKVHPYFEIADYIVMCMMVKDDILVHGQPQHSRRHPFSTWISSMLMCFSGSILSNAILGESPILAFLNQTNVFYATITWYLIFYSPFDIATKFIKFWPFRILVSMMKELYRAKKVYLGVSTTAKLFPNAYVIIVLIGTVKGAGYTLMRVLERLVRGVWLPAGHDVMQPTLGEMPTGWDVHSATKASLLASVAFALEQADIIQCPHPIIFLAVTIFFVYFKLMALLFNILDPLVPFENALCMVFLGGFYKRCNGKKSINASVSKSVPDSHNNRIDGVTSNHRIVDDKKRD